MGSIIKEFNYVGYFREIQTYKIYADRRFDFGGVHTMPYIDDVSWSCTLEAYIIL